MTDSLIGQVDLINAIGPREEYTVYEQTLGTLRNNSQKGVASHTFERDNYQHNLPSIWGGGGLREGGFDL